MANLDEALKWNECAVKDLKYDMAPRGRSVPAGIFWDSEGGLWVVPRTFPNFAIELTRWAAQVAPDPPGSSPSVSATRGRPLG